MQELSELMCRQIHMQGYRLQVFTFFQYHCAREHVPGLGEWQGCPPLSAWALQALGGRAGRAPPGWSAAAAGAPAAGAGRSGLQARPGNRVGRLAAERQAASRSGLQSRSQGAWTWHMGPALHRQPEGQLESPVFFHAQHSNASDSLYVRPPTWYRRFFKQIMCKVARTCPAHPQQAASKQQDRSSAFAAQPMAERCAH